MGFSSGRSSISLEDILDKVDEFSIAAKYLNITEVPCLINSPLREDKKPSFGLFTVDGKHLCFTDFATGDKGGLLTLLSRLWNVSYTEVLERINADLIVVKGVDTKVSDKIKSEIKIRKKSTPKIEVKIRKWKQHDIDYWQSYGISIDWLKYAEVFPISHKFITKDNQRYTFAADKYAYAYFEKKEGNVSIKIYQPFNKNGFKWCTSTDSSVISLWTKVPPTGDKICICSSLKDALCLWSNTNIPAIAIQGEGYSISNTAINELKKRYNNVFILLDNDATGLIDGTKLSKQTGFINLVLPSFEGGKDISDLYHKLQDKNKFKEIILPLFNI